MLFQKEISENTSQTLFTHWRNVFQGFEMPYTYFALEHKYISRGTEAEVVWMLKDLCAVKGLEKKIHVCVIAWIYFVLPGIKTPSAALV